MISSYLLASGLPLQLLPDAQSWSGEDLFGLVALISCLVGVMLPLDILGGYLLPNRSSPRKITIWAFVKGWIRGVMVQACFFLIASLLILAMGREVGLVGAGLVILAIGVVQVAFQFRIARLTASLPDRGDVQAEAKVAVSAALERASQWGWKPRPVMVVEHDDVGFTGGIVGLPRMEWIVVPSSSLSKLSPDQLAITIARRLEAIESGSRTRGVMLAFAWVLTGFVLSAMLPGAGVTSVGELALTCCGFTLWSFLGLLTLPTLSRQASYAIDRQLMERGVKPQTFYETLQTLDRLQDDEPKRSAVIETIFHPVPSVDNRRRESASTFPIAWHAARMTLFVSWACMGMLVRAVHCNVGRPELWVMLPTD
ncbi:hypothetical protein [Rubripirellula reticaptiva]|uniref:hypothetical protein n=1 Tax=Rubripirellula reticaptiva TaxID=2528013 RepID=UPI0011B6B533|nr:hypothetical protein [Rubripirellula reticaptiva]